MISLHIPLHATIRTHRDIARSAEISVPGDNQIFHDMVASNVFMHLFACNDLSSTAQRSHDVNCTKKTLRGCSIVSSLILALMPGFYETDISIMALDNSGKARHFFL